MGIGDMKAGKQLFYRINTTHSENGQPEKLDAKEVAQAKEFGFDGLFNLTDDMTETDFMVQYCMAKLSEKQDVEAFEQKMKDIHVKYIQKAFGVDTPIKDDETIEEYEARVKEEAKSGDKSAGLVPKIPEFGLNDSKPTNRLTYAEALRLVMEKGSIRRDGGSRECTISTPEGDIHIYLDYNITSNKNGYLLIQYPGGKVEFYDPDGNPVNENSNKIEIEKKDRERPPFFKWDELNPPEEFVPTFKPEKPIFGSDKSTPAEEVLMNPKLKQEDE